MNTTLFYEILLYLNSFYFGMFALCELGMLGIKSVHYPFPNNALFWELCMIIFLSIIEAIRILFGRKGNLTEKNIPVLISIALTVPTTLGVVYLLLWQTYVLRLEWILCSIQLGLYASEMFFAFLAIISFYKSSSY